MKHILTKKRDIQKIFHKNITHTHTHKIIILLIFVTYFRDIKIKLNVIWEKCLIIHFATQFLYTFILYIPNIIKHMNHYEMTYFKYISSYLYSFYDETLTNFMTNISLWYTHFVIIMWDIFMMFFKDILKCSWFLKIKWVTPIILPYTLNFWIGNSYITFK